MIELLIAACIVLLCAFPAHAYIDPGTGSVMIQGLIAAIVGGLFALKLHWARVKRFFRKDNDEDKDTPSEQ